MAQVNPNYDTLESQGTLDGTEAILSRKRGLDKKSTLAEVKTYVSSGAFTPGSLNLAGAAPTFASQETALIGIGTYTVPMVINDTGSTFVPIQVNLQSTGNVGSAGNQVAAARLRVDAATNNQANTALSCLQLRSDVAVNVNAATCISASLNVSAACAMPTATMQGIYVAITGAGPITCPNNVNVAEFTYKQTTGGSGVTNTIEASCNASGCSLSNIIDVVNYAGTVTNGININGVMTHGINIGSGAVEGIKFNSTGPSITSGAATTDAAIKTAMGLTAPAGSIYISTNGTGEIWIMQTSTWTKLTIN